MGQLEVGYAAVDITPPAGVELAGYGYYLDRRARGTHDPLFVRAVVLDNQDVRAALVSCEIIGLDVDLSAELCALAERRYGIAAQHILLACVHTHSGPTTCSMPALGSPDAQYMQRLKHAVVDCIGEAAGNLAAARFGFARGTVEPIGYNRALNNDSVDAALCALYFDRPGAGIVAVSHACHPVVLGVNDQISADFTGEVVRRLEQEGEQGMFFNGCCGNIDPLTHKDRGRCGSHQDAARYGRTLADAALGLLRRVHLDDWITLAAAKKTIHLPLQAADREQVEATRRAHAEQLRAEPHNARARFEVEWADKVLQAIHDGTTPTEVPFVVQALKIADATIVGLSGEVFWEIGQSIVQRLGDNVAVVAYANGVTGYIPMRYDFDNEGYASTVAPKFYGLLPLVPNVADVVTDAAVELARSL